MNLEILNKAIQEFISTHLNADISKILLKGTKFKAVTTIDIVEQIEAKLKCKNKLPTWFSSEKIYYPNKLNIEQTSSEITASYKANLLYGTSIIDITGGFGVDCLYFSKHFESVTHCEINEKLSKIVAHNYKQLDVKHIETIQSNGLAHLNSKNKSYDWIYADPSRRHDVKGKVIFLKDCAPNIPEHLDNLFKYSNNIAIKTSPLLDLSIGINELKYVKTIHIIAVKNEVKELIWILEFKHKEDINIKTVDISNGINSPFSFKLNDEGQSIVTYSEPLEFLYEPNAAVLKSGGFNSVSAQFGISKLHQHSHLYTSNALENFPGRRFRIQKIIAYNKKNLKVLNNSKVNVSIRNFPETVQQIRKKHRLKDGGNTYLFFTTNLLNKKIVIVCDKIE